jgi:hypothetical protein
MPLGIISDHDLNKEIDRLNGDNKPKAIVVDKPNVGRPVGKTEVPETVRKVVAEELINGSSKDEVTSLFKVSESSASAYKNGANSTASYDKPDKELGNHVNNINQKIASTARARLVNAIKNITPEKLQDAKLKDLSQIAKDMSVVIKNIEPPREADDNRVQFILFAPRVNKEDNYQVVDALE